MITKGIIKSIDLLGNTCRVHIPFFETAGNDPIIETATVSNTPGSYNGYKVGDAVYVAFEDGNMSTPVIIGKLYLGMEKEKADPRGVSNVEESSAAKKATLPADSKLAAEIDSTVPNTTVPYSSLSSIANGLNKLNTEVGQMDRDYGNRFKQVISRADGMQSEIEQTADQITNKVLNNKPIDEDGKSRGLGWELTKDYWLVKAYDQDQDEEGNPKLPEDGLDIFKIERDSVEINVPNVKLAGYPKVTTVRYAYSDSDEAYPSLYKEAGKQSILEEYININKFGEGGWTRTELPLKTKQEGEAEKYVWQWTQVAQYEYKKTADGDEWQDKITDTVVLLAINQTISVTKTELNKTISDNKAALEGQVADEKKAREESDAEVLALAQGKTTNYYSPTDPSKSYTIKVGDCWFKTISSGDNGYNSDAQKESQGKLYQCIGHTDEGKAIWEDIGGELVANKLTANYINALDITAQSINIPGKFKASNLEKNSPVEIGGFEVSTNGLYTSGFGTSYSKAGKTDSGVYVGKDGIKLGKNFSVDPTGHVVASSLKISSSQTIEEALNATKEAAQTAAEKTAKGYADTAKSAAEKTAKDYAETAERNAKSAAQTKLEEVFGVTAGQTVLADTWLSTTDVYAKNLTVQKADITDKLEVKDGTNTLIYANTAEPNNVKIGGFTVSQSALTAGSGNSTIGLQTASTSSAVVIDNKTYHKVNYIENIPTTSTGSNPLIRSGLKNVLNFSNGFIIEIEFMPLGNTDTNHRCCLLSSYSSTDTAKKRQNISFEIKDNKLRCFAGSITGDDADKTDFSVGQVKVGVKNKARIRVSTTYIQASLNGTASTYKFFKSSRKGVLAQDPAIFTDADKRVLFSVPLRIYSLKVWVGGVLTANIIPAVDGQLGQLIDIQRGQVLARKASSSSSSDSKFKTAHPAFFLGADDAVEAPFSVSNTGEVRAYTGDIGGFVLTDSGISSDNGLLQLYSDGTFTAKSGNIGGWTLAETGFSSDNIKLAPTYLQVGDAKLYEENSTDNRLIIKGAGGKAGFRIGRAANDSNYNYVKVKASISKKNKSWILTLGPQSSTADNTSKEGEVLSLYVLGTKILRFGRTEEICRTITWPITAGETIVNQEINLTVDFDLAANYSCYIAWTESGVQAKPSATTINKTITQATNEGKTGLNESYAHVLPYYNSLNLGSTTAAWHALYVKELYYDTIEKASLSEPGNTPPSSSTTPDIRPGGCFDAGTKVLMADGTSKNIEDIQKGDKIYSYNTQTNTYNSEEVLEVMQLVSSQNLVVLTFEDGTQLYTTTTHPFYTTAGWVSLNPLYDYSLYEDISDDYFELMTVGQTFYKVNYNSSQPEFVKLSRIQYRHGVSKDHIVYNLDVSNNNTFFANGILGHNAVTKMLPKH